MQASLFNSDVSLFTKNTGRAAMKEWPVYWDKGEAYLKTSHGMDGKREKFGPDIVYNLVSMAVEGLFMGYFMGRGGLPENHTLRDLVEFSRHYLALPPDVAEGLLAMNELQLICSVEHFSVKLPTWDEIERFIGWADTLRTVLASQLPTGSSS
jgi:hypothetical protein